MCLLVRPSHLWVAMALPKGFLKHAFAVEPAGQPLSAEDVALLERVAVAVVERQMAVPAVVFLESVC